MFILYLLLIKNIFYVKLNKNKVKKGDKFENNDIWCMYRFRRTY